MSKASAAFASSSANEGRQSSAKLQRQVTSASFKAVSSFNAQLKREQTRVQRTAAAAENLLSISAGGALSGLVDHNQRRDEERAEFQRQVQSIRKQLRRYECCTFDPHSRAVRAWDIILILAGVDGARDAV